MTEGRCLCGAVRFRLDGPMTPVGMCHCSKCRRVSGVASNANLFVARDGLEWLAGADAIRKFQLPDGWGVWRCATCGSPTPMLHPSGGAYWIPAGLLDDVPGMRVGGHIYVDSKASWDEIAGRAPRFRAGFESEKIELD